MLDVLMNLIKAAVALGMSREEYEFFGFGAPVLVMLVLVDVLCPLMRWS